MKNTNRIAIVGAGVAGIALAILATQQGYQVSVYERDSKVSSIGAGVTLWPNAIFVLQQMGVEKELKHLGGAPRLMRQFDQFGVWQGELDIEEVNLRSGFSSITILRRDLMGILAKRLDDLGVKIHLGCPMTAQDIDRLKQEFDVVVGADGRMNSVVRHTLYAEKVSPRYQGFINIIGISQLNEGVLDNAIHDFRGLGERFGIVPMNNGLCFWAGAWNADIDKQRPLSAWYDELHQRFRCWPDPVRNVLKFYDAASLNRIFVHDLDPLPYWHQDNVVIIGDAAHASLPTSGQGACQALEDAWHLVRLLGEQGELESVLTSFYQQRIVKTSSAQTVGRQVAERIFGTQLASQPATLGISAEQLSLLWMQGLETQ
ncbi:MULTISPECIES: FAD-dependent monooxygenase [unclassified Halomonas]|uniref:FAD-dependent monooxygenase n=1 Tax=Halomonas sp. N3-2A TaxID=2014541 RepID=UPI000B5B2053|nr:MULTISPECIES: FAD-dependent monooxygenase [unclassified Halomonas]ASK18756.1 monooxygenase [Halomonas sp. N3-2A]UTD54634.1 FAD-dependent monooxygenase [Halomonas sp. MS1]